jgi:hypothetical protein
MEIITLYSQYIYSLHLYTINNKYLLNTNNEIHKYKTRSLNNLHLPAVNLTKCNKGAYISGINVFNHIPQAIKMLVTYERSFKYALKRFLYHQPFYFMNEYYQFNEDRRVQIRSVLNSFNLCILINFLLSFKFALERSFFLLYVIWLNFYLPVFHLLDNLCNLL